MSSYHFITKWVVEAECAEVYRLLEEVEPLDEWWPSVYLDVKVLEKGQPGGVGKVVGLHTKGWLPYTLRWKFRVTETDFPNGFALEALGDFVGKGVWTFRQTEQSSLCEIIYDWQISAEKPVLKYLTWLLRPLFSFNHHWAMRRGEESLKLELRRRKAANESERNSIPPPPAATWPHRKATIKAF